jgi:hypothetical protein
VVASGLGPGPRCVAVVGRGSGGGGGCDGAKRVFQVCWCMVEMPGGALVQMGTPSFLARVAEAIAACRWISNVVPS